MRSISRVFHCSLQTLMSELYCCVMENITANMVDVAKTTLGQLSESIF